MLLCGGAFSLWPLQQMLARLWRNAAAFKVRQLMGCEFVFEKKFRYFFRRHVLQEEATHLMFEETNDVNVCTSDCPLGQTVRHFHCRMVSRKGRIFFSSLIISYCSTVVSLPFRCTIKVCASWIILDFTRNNTHCFCNHRKRCPRLQPWTLLLTRVPVVAPRHRHLGSPSSSYCRWNFSLWSSLHCSLWCHWKSPDRKSQNPRPHCKCFPLEPLSLRSMVYRFWNENEADHQRTEITR